MNILRVISSMDPVQGGPCQGIRNIVPALAALGVTNEVLCFDDPKAAFLGRDDFAIHAIGPSRGPYRYCSGLQPWLLQHLERFDVVIVHGLWLHSSAGTYRALMRYRQRHPDRRVPRLYVMPHGMLDPYFQRAPDRRVKAVRNWVVWKLVEGRAVNNAHGVLFTCAQELLLARIPFSPYHPRRELDVGYGIAAPPEPHAGLAQAFRQRCPQVAGRPYVLFLSRIHKKKGVDLLLRAYLDLARDRHDMPALVVAGPGLDSDYGRSLRDMARGHESVHFPGMLTGDAKWGALYGCDAFVLPSHQENFGIAVVEAMACGKPVLISNQVNIWKECAPAGLVTEDTPDGVSHMLAQWLGKSAVQHAALGDQARAVYQRHFAVAEAAKRLHAVLVAEA